MNAIDAVRTYFMLRVPGSSVVPFSDALTRLHGTVGFDVTVEESVSTLEISVELLDPVGLGQLVDCLEREHVIERMAEHPSQVILVGRRNDVPR